MNIKTILVDDERKALAILKDKISRFCPQLEIIAETQKPKEAIDLIISLEPQLVFLDVTMPEISGFDVLKEITNPHFELIFATAFDNFAIQAIEHCAIGYLVKPIDNDLLIQTVAKAINNIEQQNAIQKNRTLIENLGVLTFQDKKVVIPSSEGLEFVAISEIIHLEGLDGYTKIYFNGKPEILSSYNIGYFIKLLDEQLFFQIHKSHLINLNHIDKYLNEGCVVLSNSHKIPVARSRRQDFLNRLKG